MSRYRAHLRSAVSMRRILEPSACTASASSWRTTPMAAANELRASTKYLCRMAAPSFGRPSQRQRKQLFEARVAWSRSSRSRIRNFDEPREFAASDVDVESLKGKLVLRLHVGLLRRKPK